MGYTVFTDSSCDISDEILQEWEVKYVSLKFRFEDGVEMTDKDMPADVFYDQMRNGRVSKTAAANPDQFIEAFEPLLSEGQDILYLGFSSALSNTYNAAVIASRELCEKYPERKVICIDSLCASAGQGLLLCLAVEKKREGADIEENAEYIKETIPHLCHWFTVDDLVYLKRGGRISAATALIGSALNIKPILHVDNGGHLTNVTKVRGRKLSLKTIAKKLQETALDPEGCTYFISHGGCLDDAKKLEEYIMELTGNPCAAIITNVGPVIGSHSGPGTIALFYVGKER